MRLDRLHEHAVTRPLMHYELVQLYCFAAQARLVADLVRRGHNAACAARWQTRSSCSVLGCRNPGLQDDQDPVQAAVAANDRDRGQPAEVSRSSLGLARRYHPVPSAENTRRPDLVSTRRWPAEPLVDSTGITFRGVGTIPCCHTAIIDRQATAIIPIHRNGYP